MVDPSRESAAEPEAGNDDVRALFQRRPALSALSRSHAGTAPAPATRSRSAAPAAPTDYVSVKADLQQRVIDELQRRNLLGAGEEVVEEAVEEFVRAVLASEDLPITESEHDHLAQELVEEALGIGPLAPLMSDPAITDILVNGHDQVYIERFGRLEKTDIRFRDDDHIRRIIERLAMRVGRRIDQSSPMVDLRLSDGSRVNATLPPVTLDGPTLSIRRFGRNGLRGGDLLRLGMLSDDMARFLTLAVRHRKNVLISGGTGAGKSTLLSVMAESIPRDERVITIEDTAELVLDQEHVVRMETRPMNAEGRGLITARDLVVNALRMRPSRVIVGEVRSAEALDMLQAMNTGHEGGMCTIHANSARDALSRLETMVLMAGAELPSRAIREQMTSALDLVVHVRRCDDGGRRIASIAEITGMESGVPLLQDIFTLGRGHSPVTGEVAWRYAATGIVPRFVEQLRGVGIEVPMSLFQAPAG
ncbi:MAG: CpaF family protein [Planctomycetota bacterium]